MLRRLPSSPSFNLSSARNCSPPRSRLSQTRPNQSPGPDSRCRRLPTRPLTLASGLNELTLIASSWVSPTRPDPSKGGGGGGRGGGSEDHSGRVQQEQKVGAGGFSKGQEDDIESIASDDSVQFGDTRVRDEQEGKDMVMSRYFGTTSGTQHSNPDPNAYPSTAFPSSRESGPTASPTSSDVPPGLQRAEPARTPSHDHSHRVYGRGSGARQGRGCVHVVKRAAIQLPCGGRGHEEAQEGETRTAFVRPKPQRLLQIER